jgi:hypothetical protein
MGLSAALSGGLGGNGEEFCEFAGCEGEHERNLFRRESGGVQGLGALLLFCPVLRAGDEGFGEEVVLGAHADAVGVAASFYHEAWSHAG